METETFRERNRRLREENAFEHLYAYAQKTGIPDPKRAAEQEAKRLHGSGAAPVSAKPAPRAAAKKASGGGVKREKAAESVPHRLDDRTKEQLYARAQELDIEGRSQMTKDELIEAIRDKQ